MAAKRAPRRIVMRWWVEAAAKPPRLCAPIRSRGTSALKNLYGWWQVCDSNKSSCSSCTRVMVWTQVWGVPGESLRCPGTAWPCGRIFSFGPGTIPVTSTLTVALSSGYCSSFGGGPLRSRTLACFSFRYVAARLDLKPMARTD